MTFWIVAGSPSRLLAISKIRVFGPVGGMYVVPGVPGPARGEGMPRKDLTMTPAPPTPPRGQPLRLPGRRRRKTLAWLIPLMVVLVSAALTIPLAVLDHTQDQVEDEDGPEPAGLCKVLSPHVLEHAFGFKQLQLSVLHEGPGPMGEQQQVAMQNNGTIYSKCEYRDHESNDLDALLLKGVYSANVWSEHDAVRDSLQGIMKPKRINIPGVDVAYFGADMNGDYEVDAVDANAMGDYIATILWVNAELDPPKTVIVGIVNQLT
ncbi:MAG TPA: hypothetical protein VGG05_06875 [Pseudonocardiaceae bacterium]